MRKKHITIFLLLILITSLIPTTYVNATWLNSWNYRVKLTIDHDDIDESLTHFPVLLYISSSSGINNEDITFIFDEIGNSYQKIAITKDDGITELYVEVERWDLANEKAYLYISNSTWNISNITDTNVYLYYDNLKANNTDYIGIIGSAVGEKVWDSNYVLVNHMAGTNKGTTLDSTSYDNDFDVEEGGNPTFLINGLNGYAIDYDGSGDYSVINSDSELNSNDQTIEIIVKSNSATNPATQPQGILWKAVGTGFHREFTFTFSSGTGQMGYEIGDNIDENLHIFSISDVYDAQWHYTVGIKNGTGHDSIELFIDGIYQGTDSFVSGNGYQSTDDIEIGRIANTPNALRYLNGEVDEIRVSDLIRSYAWINATKESILDDLIDWGTIETLLQPPSDPNLLFGAGFNASIPYVELHWNHSLKDVYLFEVQNSTNGISWEFLGNTPTTNYTDTQIVNGTYRYYKVRACNYTDGAWYNSSFSNIDMEKVYFISEIGNGTPLEDYAGLLIVGLIIGLIVGIGASRS